MAEHVTDGSFEAGGSGWDLLDSAEVSTIRARTGSKSLRLWRDPLVLNIATAEQTDIDLVPGTTYQVEVWSYGADAAVALAIDIDAGSGYEITETVNPGVAGWALRTRNFIASGASGGIRIRRSSVGSGGESGWFVDDVSLVDIVEAPEEPEEPEPPELPDFAVTVPRTPRGLWPAHQGILAALVAIRGDAQGYWHDIGNRVFPKLVLPEDGGPGIYLCVPLVDDGTNYENVERGDGSRTWTVTIFGFVLRSSSSLLRDEAVEAVAKLEDDIVKALMVDPTLGGAVHDASIAGSDKWAGEGDDAEYGEVQVRLRLTQFIQGSDLGPRA